MSEQAKRAIKFVREELGTKFDDLYHEQNDHFKKGGHRLPVQFVVEKSAQTGVGEVFILQAKLPEGPKPVAYISIKNNGETIFDWLSDKFQETYEEQVARQVWPKDIPIQYSSFKL